MSQFLTGAPITLQLSVYVDGTLTDLDATPTVEVVDGAGGTVTSGAVSSAGTGIYEVGVDPLDDPNVLKATWSGALSGNDFTRVDWHEVVGGFLFAEIQFLSFAGDLFASESDYDDAAVAAAREAATEQLEAWTGIAWVPRYCRAEFAGNNLWEIRFADGYARTSQGKPLNRPGRTRNVSKVLSLTVDGQSASVDDLTVMDGRLHRSSYWPYATRDNRLNITVEYEYGQPYLVDGVDRIAMLLAKDRLRETIVSDRATSFTDDLGTYRFETPGRVGNVSTLPEVNEWVKSHAVNTIMVG